MNAHEKGRITMNANNKLLFFLGAFLSVGLMFLCIVRKAFDCLSDGCAAKK